MVVGVAWMSSRDGAVTRMAGGRGGYSAASGLHCEEGGVSVTEKESI